MTNHFGSDKRSSTSRTAASSTGKQVELEVKQLNEVLWISIDPPIP